MSYSLVNFLSRAVQYPFRKKITYTNGTIETVTIVDDPGEVEQKGTNLSAVTLGNMDKGIHNCDMTQDVIIQELRQHQRSLSDLTGEKIQITLTNTKEYPFNDSVKTIALSKNRDTLDYKVTAAIGEENNIGEVVIYDKQLNGFKVRHTGSAKSVTIKLYVQGGMM